MFRFGLLLTVAAAGTLAIALAAPFGADLPGLLFLLVPIALLAATGVGLLAGHPWARALGGLFVALGGVLMPLSAIRDLVRTPAAMWVDVSLLGLANGVATTAQLTWLCFVTLQAIRGKATNIVTTARVAGGALAIIAVNHLVDAARLGSAAWGSAGSFSFRVSGNGTAFFGFPGWPLWHLALLICAATLLAGPRRMLARAATGLALLFAVLGVLALVTVVSFGTPLMLVAVVSMVALTVSLAWWLCSDLRASALASSMGR